MRIAITGANGQLGQALCWQLAPQHTIVELNEGDFDLQNPQTVAQIVATHAELVTHPAASTNVDGCANDPELAYRINGLGTKYVALACQQLGVPIVYISTNEVFPGTSTTPYGEYDQTQPINAYGHSKWVGEQVVRDILQQFYIVRVAWLFGGERNFVRTILRLLNDPPEQGLRVVDDEVGSPTYAKDVAVAIATLIETKMYGIYHFVNEGSCSRYEFTKKIKKMAKKDGTITPITLADYPRASTPPPYTPLRNSAGDAIGITLRSWQDALAEYIETLL